MVGIRNDFQAGQENARDCIIATIIGMQNEMGHDHSERYEGMQDVLLAIMLRYGKPYEPWRG